MITFSLIILIEEERTINTVSDDCYIIAAIIGINYQTIIVQEEMWTAKLLQLLWLDLCLGAVGHNGE